MNYFIVGTWLSKNKEFTLDFLSIPDSLDTFKLSLNDEDIGRVIVSHYDGGAHLSFIESVNQRTNNHSVKELSITPDNKIVFDNIVFTKEDR